MSDLEELLEQQIRCSGLPAPERELIFARPRRWRFDMAWPALMLAAEVNGGTWIAGRHNRGSSIAADYEKLNEATLRGWRVLQFTADMVRDGRAVALIERGILFNNVEG